MERHQLCPGQHLSDPLRPKDYIRGSLALLGFFSPAHSGTSLSCHFQGPECHSHRGSKVHLLVIFLGLRNLESFLNASTVHPGALTLGKPRFMSALVSITRWPSPALAPLSLSGDNYPTFQGLDASFWCVTGTLIVRLLRMLEDCLGLASLRKPSVESAHMGCGLNSQEFSKPSEQAGALAWSYTGPCLLSGTQEPPGSGREQRTAGLHSLEPYSCCWPSPGVTV